MESLSITSGRLLASLVFILLMLSGDIERNPGPSIDDKPKMIELVKHNVIDNISSCSFSECLNFAYVLLNDDQAVKKIQKKNKEDDDEFVRAVFLNWLDRDDDNPSEPAAPRTWEALAECIKNARLPGKYAKAIRDACAPTCVETKASSHSSSEETVHTLETKPASRSSSPRRETSETKAASSGSETSETKADPDSSLPTEKKSPHTSTPQVKGKPSITDEDGDIPIVSDSPKTAQCSFDVQKVIDANPQAKGFALIVTNENYLDSTDYPPLYFTEKDGRAMEKTLIEFQFNCYFLKDLTGDEIREVLDQTRQCKYPDSYKYVAFVYSGHGDCTEDQKRSGMIGIDGPLIETTVAVINPLKAINPPSIIKMVFLDACRGSLYPPPMTKGKKTNCLVAYATQLGHYSFGNEKGSQWMIPLAEKLKQREKSVQAILKEMKQEILENAFVQYPEIHDSDCRHPIFLKGMMMTKGGEQQAVSRVAKTPNIGDLASFARKGKDEDTGMIRIIDSVASEEVSVAKSLADLLLDSKDCPAHPESDQHVHKMRFVLKVMNKWLSIKNPKVKQTWENLIECLEKAGLRKAVVKDIQDNLPK